MARWECSYGVVTEDGGSAFWARAPGPRGGNLEGRAGARGAAEAEAEEVEEAAVKEAAGSCDPIGPQEEVFFALLDFLRAV